MDRQAIGEEHLNSILYAMLPLFLAMLLYLWQSGNYFFRLHRVGLTIAFIGYTLGNIGLMIDIYEQGE
jgi:hypothetical protein